MAALPKKPKLLYEKVVDRKPYMRRFVRSMIIATACGLALVAFGIAIEQGLVAADLRTPGIIITGAATALFVLRALVNVWQGMRRRNETLRIYDQGIVWKKAGKDTRYSWSTVQTFREGGGGLYLRKRPLVQWGSHKLKLKDGQVLKLTGMYGDLRRLAQAVRGPAARVTGTNMGKALRDGEAVKLNRNLTVFPGGVQVNKQEIPWSELDVRLTNGRVGIYRSEDGGKFKLVKQFSIKSMDNAGGFLELAAPTIKNHQRQRFGILNQATPFP